MGHTRRAHCSWLAQSHHLPSFAHLLLFHTLFGSCKTLVPAFQACSTLAWRPMHAAQKPRAACLPSLPQSARTHVQAAAGLPLQMPVQSSARPDRRLSSYCAPRSGNAADKHDVQLCGCGKGIELTCMPTGSLPSGSSANPQGKQTAGRPARLRLTVIRSPALQQNGVAAGFTQQACVQMPGQATLRKTYMVEAANNGLNQRTLVHCQWVGSLFAKPIRRGGSSRAQQCIIPLQRGPHFTLNQRAHLF